LFQERTLSRCSPNKVSLSGKGKEITVREFPVTISPISGEVHMVLDNAKYHHANLLKEFPENNPHIILELLPPYSPDLNAMEGVLELVRSKGVPATGIFTQ